MAKRKPTPGKPRPVDDLNRVVIPEEVRDAIGIKKGDFVVWEVEGKRAYIIAVDWHKRP
jgi:AbrB family looped-hinge helix DNA binding protein